jgi:hypothetical protein
MFLRSSWMIVWPRPLLAVLAHVAAAAVVAVGDRQVDRQDLHFERVAGLRAVHEHRPGQDVTARDRDPSLDRRWRRSDGLDIGRRHTRLLESARSVGQHRVDVDDVADRL